MKAATRNKYGPPDVVKIVDVPKPTYAENEFRVRVHASSVNRTDTGFLKAKPAIVRLFSGLTKPKHPILGCEFAGQVEAVGAKITKFKVGDKVFGFSDSKFGGHGEYAVYTEKDSIAIMPKNASYELMAGAAEGSHYALSYIRAFKAKKDMKVLVNGATGAIGSAAVQLLKCEGAYVVATSDTKNMSLVASLGADEVINRDKEEFTDCGQLFDVVFDSVGKSTFGACKKILKKGGVYVSSELGPYGQNPIFGLFSPLLKLLGAKHVQFPLPKNNNEIIEYLARRVESGDFKPVIDSTHHLDDIVKAYERVESGQKVGNLIIKMY